MSATHDTVQSAFEALLVRARRDGTRPPTIVSVAEQAGISRSSMYRFHADVVLRIQPLANSKRALHQNAMQTKVRLLARQLKAEKDLSKALARACAELAAEKAMLLEELVVRSVPSPPR